MDIRYTIYTITVLFPVLFEIVTEYFHPPIIYFNNLFKKILYI